MVGLLLTTAMPGVGSIRWHNRPAWTGAGTRFGTTAAEGDDNRIARLIPIDGRPVLVEFAPRPPG